jgi:Xaa-Pro aminopeptidase
VVSSGDLIQQFEATWNDAQWQLHQQAARHTDQAFARAWSYLVAEVRANGQVMETAVQRQILDYFAENGLVTDHGPIVAMGPHAGDPHFETCPENDTPIREGDLVLIDLWAKLDQPDAVYSDQTRMGFVGTDVPSRYAEAFEVIRTARDAAIDFVRTSLDRGASICGWQVDDAARQVIEQAGFGESFIHRLGHSIGQETHGNGANMDNLEMRDERRILPQTCFSIEPGIYLPEFGVRTEVDVYVDQNRQVHVTGGTRQMAILPLLEAF